MQARTHPDVDVSRFEFRSVTIVNFLKHSDSGIVGRDGQLDQVGQDPDSLHDHQQRHYRDFEAGDLFAITASTGAVADHERRGANTVSSPAPTPSRL